MALKNTNQYDDIIGLPRPICRRASRMTNYDRAAQFSPFAALTGFEAAIGETARLTDSKIELDEYEKARIDETLRQIQGALPHQPEITATYFTYDERKSGGTYVTAQGRVQKIDGYSQNLLLTDGRRIPIRELIFLHTALDAER